MSEKVTPALVRLQRITEEVELLLGQETKHLEQAMPCSDLRATMGACFLFPDTIRSL